MMGKKNSLEELKLKLGRNIRERRKALNLTQVQLAEKVGIHQRFISSLERGEYNASIEYLYNISIVLEIDYKELFK